MLLILQLYPFYCITWLTIKKYRRNVEKKCYVFSLIDLMLNGMLMSIFVAERFQQCFFVPAMSQQWNVPAIFIFALFRADLSQFQYLTMVIKESLRLCTPVSGVFRQLDEPMTLKSKFLKMAEVVLPKKSSIMVNLHTLSNNPHVWDNPQVRLYRNFK